MLLPRGHPCAVRAWRWLLSSSCLVFQWQEGAGNAGRVQWAAVLAHHQVFLGLAEVRIAVFSVTSPTLTPLAPGLGVSALYS